MPTPESRCMHILLNASRVVIEEGTSVMRDPGAAKQYISDVSEDVVEGEGGTSVAHSPTNPSSRTVLLKTDEPCLLACRELSCLGEYYSDPVYSMCVSQACW